MKTHAPAGTLRVVLLRRAGISLAVAAIAASAVLLWTTTRAERVASRIASAVEMIHVGGEAQRALSVYNKQSDLFRRTRGSDNQIEPTGPERELQHFLTLLDRCAKERPRGAFCDGRRCEGAGIRGRSRKLATGGAARDRG